MIKRKMTRQESGRAGGLANYARHGSEHMATIGRKGGQATRARYRLEPIGQSGWAMINRETNQVKNFINYIPGR
jgi:general stress protein YciG